MKQYIYTFLGVIAATFIGLFKYRGHKIKALNKDVNTERDNADKHEEEIKKVIAELNLREKYNEIDKSIIMDSPDNKRSRLSAFNKD